MDNRNGVEILDESDINKSPNISKNEKKDNDLIENDDIKIEDKSKVKNEKEELKNENNKIIINKINNNNISSSTKFKIPSKLKNNIRIYKCNSRCNSRGRNHVLGSWSNCDYSWRLLFLSIL